MKLTEKIKRAALIELRKPEPDLEVVEDIILGYEFPDITGIQGPQHPMVRVSYGNVLASENNLVALETLEGEEVYYYGVKELIQLFKVK